jgi:hypothetical protein
MSEVKVSSFGPILSLPLGSVSGFCVLHDTIEQVIMANRNSLFFLMMIKVLKFGGKGTFFCNAMPIKTFFCIFAA